MEASLARSSGSSPTRLVDRPRPPAVHRLHRAAAAAAGGRARARSAATSSCCARATQAGATGVRGDGGARDPALRGRRGLTRTLAPDRDRPRSPCPVHPRCCHAHSPGERRGRRPIAAGCRPSARAGSRHAGAGGRVRAGAAGGDARDRARRGARPLAADPRARRRSRGGCMGGSGSAWASACS